MGANGNGDYPPGTLLERPRLLATDFDETMARTSEPAPNGMTVALAYEHGVGVVLGQKALATYKSQGGLRNRAPHEVITELVPGTELEVAKQRTEDLVEAKLSILAPQVGKSLADGSRWPRPTEGFIDLWVAVSEQAHISTGVTSSGHEAFIRRFCDVQEIAQPDIMGTDDDMRPLVGLLPPEICVKPGRLIMDLVHQRWLTKIGLQFDYDTQVRTRELILGVGDDGHDKDSHLAANAGVKFIRIDPGNSAPCWQQVGCELQLPTYVEAKRV